ncbi:Glycoside hydrolase, family 28 [Dillenia turbinata]|uniref:Glycoside hydrolase, family 28 n=1 Tax=Dillenia turbinata TaxID=194707 RepID=A0AAN8YU28_9MAGN
MFMLSEYDPTYFYDSKSVTRTAKGIMFAIFIFFCAASTGSGREVPRSQSNIFDVMEFGAVADGETDDSSVYMISHSPNAFLEAWENACDATGDVSTLVVPEGTYLLQPVLFQGPCESKNIHVEIRGTLVAPPTLEDWKYCDRKGWIKFKRIDGLRVGGCGQIDGRGSLWWEEFRKMGMYSCDSKLTAMAFHSCNDVKLSGLHHLNPPKNHISVNGCRGVIISNLTLVAPDYSPNTDGINLSMSTNVTIRDSFIGTGDDCVAINGNTTFVNITGVKCGPGHGISLGDPRRGSPDIVEEVHVSNCVFNGTTNGARIKTWQGGKGYARRISFENITLIKAKNPIIIDQFYCNGKHNCKEQESAVKVSDVTYERVKGTCINKRAVTFNCSDTMSCDNIIMKEVMITSHVNTFVTCNNANGISNSTVPDASCLFD